ncbi:hypothetical protein [Ancylobacter pratisalsi]|uniref:Uncharacterized protein n=1 Tax=Ancylobacter pratisalsi TaxID=1745854 RepID=A0A6P1YNN7_9HYPH|nr:hypothetical protein [Ancylobacter pratisalsi]QIB34745.1 hypothetical protein G3A50_14295 [Ancylobacter pratisalsi]
MILGGLAANSGFSAKEIESFDVDQARWWWNALSAYHQRVKEIQDQQ